MMYEIQQFVQDTVVLNISHNMHLYNIENIEK
jgi:hypothetical protein